MASAGETRSPAGSVIAAPFRAVNIRLADFSADQQFLIGCVNAGLQPGETSLDAAVGILSGISGGQDIVPCIAAMVITDHRVLIQCDRTGGYERLGFECREVAVARHESEGQLGSILLQTSADEFRISQVPDLIGARAAGRVTEKIAALGREATAHLPVEAPALSHNAVFSVADEIRKFADLHAEGILTDTEFAAKKEQLLGTTSPAEPATEP